MVLFPRVLCRFSARLNFFNSVRVIVIKSNMTATNMRFVLYVKACGNEIGDCPFSARTLSVCKMKVKDYDNTVKVVPIDTSNKPADFLAMNPGGKVPFLSDTLKNINIEDSSNIVQYFDKLCPDCDMKIGYNGPAVVATEHVFGKFYQYMMCKDESQLDELKGALVAELDKINKYLTSKERKGKYLINDDICDMDCSLFPKLRHIVVAGKEFRNFIIPSEYVALLAYYEAMQDTGLFTFLTDAVIVTGWSRHF